MAQDRNAENETNPLIRTMRSTVGRESTTFGFSILVTAACGVLQVTQGAPDLPRVLLCAANPDADGGHEHGHRLGAGCPERAAVHLALWVLAPFVAGVVYLVTESIEAAIAEQIVHSSGDHGADDVSD
ncbi:hypothetical protein [Modestobacter sp. SYSU DS0657]